MATPNNTNIAQTRSQGRWTATRILGCGPTKINLGVWLDAQLMHPFSVTIGGTFTGTVRVAVSNGILLGYNDRGDPNIGPPTDTDDAWPSLGPDLITTPYAVLSNGPYKFVSIREVVPVTGDIQVVWSAAVTVSDKA